MKPANTVAETVAQLREDNLAMAKQIEKNSKLIEQLNPLAEWTEEPEQNPIVLDES
jgi:hypothetical protein